MSSFWNNVHSWVASIMRLGRGLASSNPRTDRPSRLLQLYEFEACPYCRKVREALSELDLEYVCHPAARGSNNRQKVVALGGKALFPFLIDPNTGRQMYESEDILTYLADTYGTGRSASNRTLAPLNTLGSTLVSALRPMGRAVRDAHQNRIQPARLLELYNFEASPYCRKVRERLNVLNLDVIVHSVAKNGIRRPELVALGGKMQVPYLVDPNTGAALYESADIITYLERTYGE